MNRNVNTKSAVEGSIFSCNDRKLTGVTIDQVVSRDEASVILRRSNGGSFTWFLRKNKIRPVKVISKTVCLYLRDDIKHLAKIETIKKELRLVTRILSSKTFREEFLRRYNALHSPHLKK